MHLKVKIAGHHRAPLGKVRIASVTRQEKPRCAGKSGRHVLCAAHRPEVLIVPAPESTDRPQVPRPAVAPPSAGSWPMRYAPRPSAECCSWPPPSLRDHLGQHAPEGQLRGDPRLPHRTGRPRPRPVRQLQTRRARNTAGLYIRRRCPSTSAEYSQPSLANLDAATVISLLVLRRDPYPPWCRAGQRRGDGDLGWAVPTATVYRLRARRPRGDRHLAALRPAGFLLTSPSSTTSSRSCHRRLLHQRPELRRTRRHSPSGLVVFWLLLRKSAAGTSTSRSPWSSGA